MTKQNTRISTSATASSRVPSELSRSLAKFCVPFHHYSNLHLGNSPSLQLWASSSCPSFCLSSCASSSLPGVPVGFLLGVGQKFTRSGMQIHKNSTSSSFPKKKKRRSFCQAKGCKTVRHRILDSFCNFIPPFNQPSWTLCSAFLQRQLHAYPIDYSLTSGGSEFRHAVEPMESEWPRIETA